MCKGRRQRARLRRSEWGGGGHWRRSAHVAPPVSPRAFFTPPRSLSRTASVAGTKAALDRCDRRKVRGALCFSERFPLLESELSGERTSDRITSRLLPLRVSSDDARSIVGVRYDSHAAARQILARLESFTTLGRPPLAGSSAIA